MDPNMSRYGIDANDFGMSGRDIEELEIARGRPATKFMNYDNNLPFSLKASISRRLQHHQVVQGAQKKMCKGHHFTCLDLLGQNIENK